MCTVGRTGTRSSHKMRKTSEKSHRMSSLSKINEKKTNHLPAAFFVSSNLLEQIDAVAVRSREWIYLHFLAFNLSQFEPNKIMNREREQPVTLTPLHFTRLILMTFRRDRNWERQKWWSWDDEDDDENDISVVDVDHADADDHNRKRENTRQFDYLFLVFY